MVCAGIVLRCKWVQVYAVRPTVKRMSRPQGVSNWNDNIQEKNIAMWRMCLCAWVVGMYWSDHIMCKECRDSRYGWLQYVSVWCLQVCEQFGMSVRYWSCMHPGLYILHWTLKSGCSILQVCEQFGMSVRYWSCMLLALYVVHWTQKSRFKKDVKVCTSYLFIATNPSSLAAACNDIVQTTLRSLETSLAHNLVERWVNTLTKTRLDVCWQIFGGSTRSPV